MKQVEVSILGQVYMLGCPEGGEALLNAAVATVDKEMTTIRDAGKVKARERIAVLAALNVAYQLAERGGAPLSGAAHKASDAGVDIVHLAEFHNGQTPRLPAPERLRQLRTLHAECARLSDDQFLLLPGEEPTLGQYSLWTSRMPNSGVRADFVGPLHNTTLGYTCGPIAFETLFLFRATTENGDSGAPVVAADGTLIGMHIFGAVDQHGQKYSYAIPAYALFDDNLFSLAQSLGVDREAAAVATQIENALAGAETGQGLAIVALVEEKPRLVLAAGCDAELQPVLDRSNIVRHLGDIVQRDVGDLVVLEKEKVGERRLRAFDLRREQRLLAHVHEQE